ncbi:MAG TPA: hypothetical protein VMW48_12545 [Vicinamibacterales bacterium]|nr:hypothetical protein [Vicinamibacterales bacterium]
MLGQLVDSQTRGAIVAATAAAADIAAGHGPGFVRSGIAGVIPPGVGTTVQILAASVPGTVLGFAVKLNTAACAVAETLVIQLLKNATTLLAVGDLTLSIADGMDVTPATLTLVVADLDYVAGDAISMVVTQAGGAPPLAEDLIADLAIRNT